MPRRTSTPSSPTSAPPARSRPRPPASTASLPSPPQPATNFREAVLGSGARGCPGRSRRPQVALPAVLLEELAPRALHQPALVGAALDQVPAVVVVVHLGDQAGAVLADGVVEDDLLEDLERREPGQLAEQGVERGGHPEAPALV